MAGGDDGRHIGEVLAPVNCLGLGKGHRIEFERDKTFPLILERGLQIAQTPVRFPCRLFFQYGHLFRQGTVDRLDVFAFVGLDAPAVLAYIRQRAAVSEQSRTDALLDGQPLFLLFFVKHGLKSGKYDLRTG